jgi:hypothetical protein
MEHQEAIYFLIMVSLVLGIGNTYYIVKYLARTRPKDTGNTSEDGNKTTDI